MHLLEFPIIDRSVLDNDHVFYPRALSVQIESGRLAFPVPATSPGIANRLLIFTGTVAAELQGDDNVKHGVLRIQLHNPLPAGVKFIGSATVAALAAFHTDDDQVLLGLNSAETIQGPNPPDGNFPPSTLPADDVYVIVDLSVMSTDAHLDRLSYQANVLLRDDNPDLESVLVRLSGFGEFGPTVTLQPDQTWEYEITLTGPVLKASEAVTVTTSDPVHVPITAMPFPGIAVSTVVGVPQGEVSATGVAPAVSGSGTLDTPSTITAFFTRADGSLVSKTASIHLTVLK